MDKKKKAGAPKKSDAEKKQRISIRFAPELAMRIKELPEGNRSATIENATRLYFAVIDGNIKLEPTDKDPNFNVSDLLHN